MGTLQLHPHRKGFRAVFKIISCKSLSNHGCNQKEDADPGNRHC